MLCVAHVGLEFVAPEAIDMAMKNKHIKLIEPMYRVMNSITLLARLADDRLARSSSSVRPCFYSYNWTQLSLLISLDPLQEHKEMVKGPLIVLQQSKHVFVKHAVSLCIH